MNRSLQKALSQAAMGAMVAWGGLAATPAHALYKVVGPDGKISYTDRAPTEASNKVVPINASGGTPSAVSLPIELRQAVERFPVTLYVLPNGCDACGTARQLLRQRGIPFSERQVSTPEDGDALQRLTGAREAPALTIGAQVLRGVSTDQWMQYLDAAGYPKTSRLPASYRDPEATPLVPPREPARAAEPTPAPSTGRTSPPADDGTGIRF